MFKNPLKYQQGGQLNQEQQQMLAAFIDWLPKRVKEFEGMQPEAIVQALDGMSKTPEGQRQVQAYVEQFQSEMNGVASHKLGGKIQDFICKHAKGGHVGCGCTKKGAEGIVIDEPEYTWGQYDRNDFLNSGENHIGWTKVTTPDGRIGWARNYRRKFLGIPSRNLDQILVTPDLEDGKYRSVGRGLNGFFGNGQIDTVYRFRNPEDDTKNRRNIINSSLEGVAPERKQDGGLVRAKNYYSNHANAGIIRKLQNFLLARGYNLGDSGIDGKFGQTTYEAIRQYQRDNGLVDDGMWGEDTNNVHRVLGAGETTFNGPNSGAHMGTHTYTENFVNQPYSKPGKITYSQINDAIAKGISNPEWFWGDSDDANAWRRLFQKNANGDPGAILRQIYESTPEEIRQTIDINKLPNDLKSRVYNKDIAATTNEAAPVVAGISLAPIAVTNPLTTIGSMVGASVLGNVGERIGSDMRNYEVDPNTGMARRDSLGKGFYVNKNNEPATDITGTNIPSVKPDYAPEGRATGTAIGSVLGGLLGGKAGDLRLSFDRNYNPTGIEMKLPEPRMKEIIPKKSNPSGPKRPGTQRPGNAKNFLGRPANWTRRLTGETIPESSISGYFMEKNGGKVEKAQEGATIEPYYNSNPINEWIKNKFNNNSTLYHLQQGFQNFKESAPGKVLSFFIPNPNSETGMLSAAAPVGKITSGSQFVSRIPKQKPSIKIMEDLGNGRFSAIDDTGKAMMYDSKLDKNLYDIDKTFNTDNFINNIDLSNLIEKNTFSKRFIKYLKNDVLPHTDTDWLKYGLGSIGGATAEAALIKYMQNKENKQSSKNKK